MRVKKVKQRLYLTNLDTLTSRNPLTSMIFFGGGARLVGPASALCGMGQFHLGGVQVFAPVEESLRNALPCNSLAATFAAHSQKDETGTLN